MITVEGLQNAFTIKRVMRLFIKKIKYISNNILKDEFKNEIDLQ